jgi:acetyl-CoA C-acetyltransferase
MIGAGQFMEKGKSPSVSLPPMGIAAAAGQRALDDTGAPKQVAAALDALVSVRIFPDSWNRPRDPNPFGRAENPPFAIASRLGAEPELGIYGNVGGNTPQKYINEMADRIVRGEIEMAMVVGGEALKTAQLAVREGIDLDWQEQDNRAFEDRGIGESLSTPHEFAHGLGVPIQTYPLFENALRHRDQHSLRSHLAAMASLMQPFNAVASQNPYASYGEPRSAQELATVTAENRFICLPYPKWMNAMDGVNQGAAVILTSVAKARELGIGEDKWVFLHGCSEANERLLVSERLNYSSSPALGMNTRQALAMAGKTLAEMECFDIYSCFPSAVAIACEELGLARDDPRGLTVTGGLPFFGGPGNNYSLHGIASMVEKLRRKPSAFGLITANGGYLTKHASGVYSCQPLASEWQLPDSDSIQREVDSLDYPVFTETPQGDATIETYTVCFKRGEPVRSIVIGRLLTTNERFVANTAAEPQLFDDLIKHDWIGRRGQVRQCGELNLFEPV